jgi:hypothetical protein
VVGQAHRVGDPVAVGAARGRVGLLGGGAAGDVLGEAPVHGAVVRRHQVLHLAQQRGEIGHLPAGATEGPNICSKGVPLNGF